MRFPLGNVLRCGCAMAGFLVTAAVLHRVFPPDVPDVSAKMKMLAGYPCDTLFVGSSRFYYGISPEVFDSTMAAGGRPVRSFNLGVPGVFPPELFHLLRAVLAAPPKNLRRVFLELARSREIFDSDLTLRDIYWWDLESLRFASRQAVEDYRTSKREYRWPNAWKDLSGGLDLFARNEANMGRFAPDPVFQDTPPLPAMATAKPLADGFLPLHGTLPPAETKKYEEELAVLREGGKKKRPPNELNRQYYAKMSNLLKARGIELILITTPSANQEIGARGEQPAGVPLLDFDDPDRHPELFLPENRMDYNHLNEAGARIFSRELAEACLARPPLKQ